MFFTDVIILNKKNLFLSSNFISFYSNGMNQKKYFSLLLLLIGLYSNGQARKWTLEECVKYALDHNISIRQTELDAQTAAIDKKMLLVVFCQMFLQVLPIPGILV